MGGRQEHYQLDVPASDGSGSPVVVRDLVQLIVAVSGTFSASIQIEMSFDEAQTWHSAGSPLVAAGVREVNDAASHARATVSDYVSGDPVGVVAGRNARA